MKPINLRIKGLNSFIDTQEINFEKLTDRGLFGIFGPTGSGKSTVLDGITLALYGEVARKSSNFINTNCESLNVSFEFQISEKEVKTYIVEREFRRDKKTDSVRSKFAKVVSISGNSIEILEEGATDVTKKCEEIIGLKLEDFTRTVVLPQGNFSEFLKLEGKDRRNMLERLFNLQKYGDTLSIKLSSRIKVEKEKENILIGELKGYEDCSVLILEEREKELSAVIDTFAVKKEELDQVEAELKNGKELWDIQNELKMKKATEQKLKEQESTDKENQSRVARAESALKILPYLEPYEMTAKDIDVKKKELALEQNKMNQILADKERIDKSYESALSRKEQKLDGLKIQEQKVLNAIETNKVIVSLKSEVKRLEETLGMLQKKQEKTTASIQSSKEAIDKHTQRIQEKEVEIDTTKIPVELKNKVNEGVVLFSQYNDKKTQKENAEQVVAKLEDTIKEEVIGKELAANLLKQKQKEWAEANEAHIALMEKCPGDPNTLLELQQKRAQVADQWNKYNEAMSEIRAGNESTEIKQNDFKEKCTEITLLSQKIIDIERNIRKIETDNMAYILRKALTNEDVCPVCGSQYHQVECSEELDPYDLQQLKSQLEDLKMQKIDLSADIKTIENILKQQEENVLSYQKKIAELGDEFKAYSVEALTNEFDSRKEAMNQYNKSKSELEETLKNAENEGNNQNVHFTRIETALAANEKQLAKQKDELAVRVNEYSEKANALASLKQELGIDDFKSKSNEITHQEQIRNQLEKDIKTLREELSNQQKTKEMLDKEASEDKVALKETETSYQEKKTRIHDMINKIVTEIGTIENLDEVQKEVMAAIKEIQNDFHEAEKNKKEIEESLKVSNDKIIKVQTKYMDLQERFSKEKENLEKVIHEAKFMDINDVKENLLAKEAIDDLKNKIQDYQISMNKILGAIESLVIKIGDKSLSEEEWNAVQKDQEEKKKQYEQVSEEKIKLQGTVKSLSDRLRDKEKLLQRKDVLEKLLSLLDDLEKLFKGKKFVEYVATNQLKYVSIEACKKLKDITGGNYGLEVDENGKFLIRDYKNGGAQRDASTLSGGETFLVSLALALALSAQIQLKGIAPLELFFLDEGFGTLDDNLLEVVMDSLEKVHHDKLSIGLISHVEAIKNRVPVKLIVTPAVAGLGGSKVKIERN